MNLTSNHIEHIQNQRVVPYKGKYYSHNLSEKYPDVRSKGQGGKPIMEL